MIADTTFIGDLLEEHESGIHGPAVGFLAAHRNQPFSITVITVGEIGAMYDDQEEARRVLATWRQLRLTPEIAHLAAAIDRELIHIGLRLGENDNWIAGFCRYYGQPLVSRDRDFDRVRGLRRMAY